MLPAVDALASVLGASLLAMTTSAAVAQMSTTSTAATTRHSVGTPRNGSLEGGVRLSPGPGYFVRKAATSWGTPTTVGHLRAVLASLHEAYPDSELRVGDLSARHGGTLEAHQAHQSGRDADVGLVPPPGVRPRGRFEGGQGDGPPMDPAATLHLLRLLAATSDEPGGAQWVLLDYEVQRVLHARAVAEGIDPEEIDALFQYPHGRRADRGFARHFSGHRRHMHVRFACAPDDRACRGRRGPPRS